MTLALHVTPDELDNILTNRWTPEKLLSLFAEHFPSVLETLVDTCPDCGEHTIKDVGTQVVCTTCGVVLEEFYASARTQPFGETYALTAKVVKGNSLGGTLPNQLLGRVLTRSPNLREVGLTKEDEEFIRQIMETAKQGGTVSIKEAQEGVKRYLKKIPMTHIKTQINQLECPQAEKLKEELTALLSKYGFFKTGDYNPFDHQLADMCGVLAQRIGQFLNAGLGKPPASYKKLASAIIIHLLRPTHPYLVEEIEINEEPSIVDLAGIACVLQCPMLNNVSKLKNL